LDPLTHLLSGALVARATYPEHRSPPGLSPGERTLAGSLAAIAPDIDYLIVFYDTLAYLNWHRGITHSLVLMPFAGLLLAWVFARLFGRVRRRSYRWQDFYWVCLLGIAVHIVGDCLTPYGTMLLAPLSDAKYSLSTTFVVDPWLTAIILFALVFSMKWPIRSERVGFLVLGGYLGLQLVLNHEARDLAREYALNSGLSGYRVYALPQPLSPFNWKLMVVDGELYHSALVDLGPGDSASVSTQANGILQRLAAAYRPVDELEWKVGQRFGKDSGKRALARDAWHQTPMGEVRRFSLFPAVFRLGGEGSDLCIRFTDLRFVLPVLDPPFQFRVCKPWGAGDWGQVEVTRNLRIRDLRGQVYP